jgi:cytoskeletal protein CcmA (bactofilin family)
MTTEILVANTRVQTPAIIGLTSINGSAYPPPLVSTFQRLFTSTLTASTITTAGNATIGGDANVTGTVTAGSFSSAGNYNGLSATYPGVNISLAGNGNISATNISANGAIFRSTSISSITTSSINGVAYPPPSGYNPNPSFSTITVATLASVTALACSGPLSAQTITTSGTIAGPNATLGGVNIGPGGVISGAIVTGTQGNFSGIVRTQAILNPALGQPISIGSPLQGNQTLGGNNPWIQVISSMQVDGSFRAGNIFSPTISTNLLNISSITATSVTASNITATNELATP